MRVVVCAANRARFTGEVIIGIRHYDPFMRKQMEQCETYGDPVDQGFVDQFGVFMDRKEALSVAIAAGQINTRCPKTNPADILFSEDLY